MTSKYVGWTITTLTVSFMAACAPESADLRTDRDPTTKKPGSNETKDGPAAADDPKKDEEAPAKPRVGDLRIAGAQLNADRTTTISLAWTAVVGATSYRIERAPSVSGEPGAFVSVQTSASGTIQTFKDATGLDKESLYRVVTISDAGESPSESVAAYPIAKSSYDLRNKRIPGLRADNQTPFSYAITGEVRHPKTRSAKPYPLVLMMHGNHAVCRSAAQGDYCPTMPTTGSVINVCPDGNTTIRSVDGYDYLLETLAAQGYVTVSIDANGMNCRNDFIGQRAQLFLEHLRQWKTFAATGAPAPLGSALVGAVDLTRVGLMGHSRGAEAASLVPQEIALTPIAGVDVKSVFAIAPTGLYAARPTNAAYSVLAPLCDGDVWDTPGIQNYDRVRNDPTRTSSVSQLLYAGANHNYFNDVWTEDDNGAFGGTRTCASAALVGGGPAAGKSAQRGMVSIAMTDWYAATLREAAVPLPGYLRGEGGAPGALNAWAGTAIDLRASYSGPKHKLIDDFKSKTANQNALGLRNTSTEYAQAVTCMGQPCDVALGVCTASTCKGFVGKCTGVGCGKAADDYVYQMWHRFTDVSALALAWKAGTARTAMDLGDLDASSYGAVAFRVAVADSVLNAPGAAQDLTVRVTDVAGEVAELKLSAIKTIPRLYPTRAAGDTASDVRPAKEILQTVRLPKATLLEHNGKLDLAHLKRLDLAMNVAERSQGAVFVTDVELTE